jgi:hypothetical protein
VYGCLYPGHHTLIEYLFAGLQSLLCCLSQNTFPLLVVLKVLIPVYISLGLNLAFSMFKGPARVLVDRTVILSVFDFVPFTAAA